MTLASSTGAWMTDCEGLYKFPLLRNADQAVYVGGVGYNGPGIKYSSILLDKKYSKTTSRRQVDEKARLCIWRLVLLLKVTYVQLEGCRLTAASLVVGPGN